MTTWSLCPLGFDAELDTLEIRLRTQDPVVDVFVIAEATVSFAGEPKPLHLAANQERFEEWGRKIRYVVVDDMPAGDWGDLPDVPFSASATGCWARENHQRNALARGCGGMRPGDLVHLSDLDEICSPTAFRQARSWLERTPIARPALPLHVGKLNWCWPDPVPVIARFMRGYTFLELGPQGARVETGHIVWPPADAADAYGHHLSYLGGPAAIAHKIRQAAHAELNQPEFTDETVIAARLENGVDLFDRPDRRARWVGLDRLPECVADDPSRYAHLLCDHP